LQGARAHKYQANSNTIVTIADDGLEEQVHYYQAVGVGYKELVHINIKQTVTI
jgi:hypothetical protein